MMKKWVNIFCLLSILIYLGLYFKPHYIFNQNIIAGGDAPSHYGLAHYVTENNKFFGWMPGNFAGYPAFQFYPPVSFFLIFLLSQALSLQVAFKMVMVLGTFLVPLAFFYALRKLEFSFPTPVLGAVFSLLFLFNEGNSMWGGNILSTLAGEFSYSLGYALAVACLGVMHKSVTRGKGIKYLALFLAVIGLTHGYSLLFILLVSSFFFLVHKKIINLSFYFASLYGLAFLLMGFWLIPALFYLPYTTSYRFVWRFESISEFIPPLFYPLVAVIFLSHIYLLLSKRMSSRIFYLWYAALMSGVGYLLGFHLGVVDIRFLPFAQGILALLAAVGLGESLKGLKALSLVPVAFLMLTVVGISRHSKLVEPWIFWNFSGFEEKPLYESFIQVNNYLKGSQDEPRVAYEHSSLHEGAGTVRAFENLPLFSGRSTLEGLYMQSAITSPFVYYLQSEISQQGSHPLMDYNYPRFDLKRAASHLSLFNVYQFIAVTPTTQNAASACPSYELEKDFSPYQIFRLKGHKNGYVVPLKHRPIFVNTEDWKRLFFDWFRWARNDVFLIFPGKKEIPEGYCAFPLSQIDLSQLSAAPLEEQVVVREKVSSHRIDIETNRPGHPLLIKISYHPNWHVQGAKTVFLASPGFMIVFPDKHKVRLHYGSGWVNHIGWGASLLGLILVIVPLSLTRLNSGLTLNLKWRWIFFLVLMVGVISSGFHFHYDAHTLYQKGLEFFQNKEYGKAQKIFFKGIKEFPYSPAADGTYLYYGLCYYKKKKWRRAISIWRDFLDRYPESRSADEILYHIGLSYQHLGDEQKAKALFDELKTRFPQSRFSTLVR